MKRTKKTPESHAPRHRVQGSLAEQQDGQIQVLRGLLEQTRAETDELSRVKADLAAALTELQEFRERHRERETEIERLLQRTRNITHERAHLVIAGTELLREVRYAHRQCERITQGARA